MQSLSILISSFILAAHAAPGPSDSGSACKKSPYNVVVPLVSGYAPAQSYCSSKYPLAASTTVVTTTVGGCISTAAPATPTKREAEPDTKLIERGNNDAKKKALAALLANKQAIISTACSCIQTPTTIITTTTTTLPLPTTVPTCCNNTPFAEIRQQGTDLFGVCSNCAYSVADNQYTSEPYPYNTNCDFVQYCIKRCEARGDDCQGVTEQIPGSDAYPNCQFLRNAVGGGSFAGDSDTMYRLPAGVPLCGGTQITPAMCACDGGGDCVPV